MNCLPLLTVLTFLPLAGGLVVIGLAAEQKNLARRLGLEIGFAALALALVIWSGFDSNLRQAPI